MTALIAIVPCAFVCGFIVLMLLTYRAAKPPGLPMRFHRLANANERFLL